MIMKTTTNTCRNQNFSRKVREESEIAKTEGIDVVKPLVSR